MLQPKDNPLQYKGLYKGLSLTPGIILDAIHGTHDGQMCVWLMEITYAAVLIASSAYKRKSMFVSKLIRLRYFIQVPGEN